MLEAMCIIILGFVFWRIFAVAALAVLVVGGIVSIATAMGMYTGNVLVALATGVLLVVALVDKIGEWK